ncbi:ABC-2 type transport system ATP-binding protein [Natronoarchaeum philippinense]|uniref:ABC-2 type transport system ATP-binding protein n=1 Tax=Natronoarchaeum philippinense TaxID=558529 RepID=A0A285NB34_NATPI|nr:ABC transporter ATP-binding protein [Natronoarchaeum philippinense]SNZ05176.1 ABC-2 type transport system ATP-binding protein [Natronoarchaeum philippinense]
MPPAIETTDLVKEYGDLRALDGLSLRVEEGEFFGLLGPNGAGKTTFINILVGLARKSGGEARVFGHDVVEDYQQARDAIGLAPQEFNVDRFFPIIEVLEHKAGYHGVPPEEATERAERALERVGILHKRDERFDWLSGGMKRRFLLARALVTDPDLLILDEPTAGVDVQLRHDLWDVVRQLNDEGTTILLTTHYIEEAERLCDRVAILNEGSKLDVSTPEELMGRGTDTIYVRVREEQAAAEPERVAAAATAGGDGGQRTEADAGAIDADGTAANVPAGDRLTAIDGVQSATVEDGRLAVRARNGGATAPDVLNALEAEGYEIADLEISRTSLEEIFVEMTNRERGDR